MLDITPQVRKELIKYLTNLGTGKKKPNEQEVGLCNNLKGFLCFDDKKALIGYVSKNWPKSTGNPLNPVPHPTLEDWKAYATSSIPKWDRRTQYGKARCRMCLWLAEELKAKRI